jgi:hypothetical protein
MPRHAAGHRQALSPDPRPLPPWSLPMLKFFEAVFDALALVVNIIDRTSSR